MRAAQLHQFAGADALYVTIILHLIVSGNVQHLWRHIALQSCGCTYRNSHIHLQHATCL